MRLLRSLILSAALVCVLAVPALAIQPGTTGTEKRFQEQGLRSGVLLQKNNTATSTGAQLGVATLNAAGSGVITTPSIAQTADSEYALTLTNDMIAAGDVVLASVAKGTATDGLPYIAEVTPAAGSVLIKVRNASGGATFNGTFTIRFLVVKQNANGLD